MKELEDLRANILRLEDLQARLGFIVREAATALRIKYEYELAPACADVPEMVKETVNEDSY